MCAARPIRSRRSSTADPHRTPDPEEQHAGYDLAEALHIFWIICSLNLRKCWRKEDQNPYGAPSPSCFWQSASACGTEQETEKCYGGGYLYSETKNESTPTCGLYRTCTGSGNWYSNVIVLPWSKIVPRTHQEGNCEDNCKWSRVPDSSLQSLANGFAELLFFRDKLEHQKHGQVTALALSYKSRLRFPAADESQVAAFIARQTSVPAADEI